MNARTFGTDDRQAEFFATHGTASYEETGQAIAEAERQAAIDTNGSAWVSEQNRNYAERTQQAFHANAASEKAIDYLVALSASRTPHVAEDTIRRWAGSVHRQLVSDKIDWLKTLPVAQRQAGTELERHNVPAGRYAVTGSDGHTVFVRVDRPTEGQWAGRIFVKIQAGDDLHKTGRQVADALLAKIAADGVEAAMLRYGRELGSCGHCGRTLTNEESRSAGIGPKCRSNMGW